MQIEAYAKINLTLDVVGRRPNGYHDVQMVMQQVSLHDTVTLAAADKITLTCSRKDLPCDRRNLAYRAAELFLKETGLTGGAAIAIEKRIPVGSGMAGGSTDAAAVLKGLNILYNAGLTDGALCRMGAALGADVPFCIMGKTMLAEGIGEVLTPLPPMPDCLLVLAKPAFSVSTQEVYEAFDGLEQPAHPATEAMLAALQAQNLPGVAASLGNVLEPVTGQHPEIAAYQAVLRTHGALGTCMSGSGPTVFGIFTDEAGAEAARAQLAEQTPQVYIVRPIR